MCGYGWISCACVFTTEESTQWKCSYVFQADAKYPAYAFFYGFVHVEGEGDRKSLAKRLIVQAALREIDLTTVLRHDND